MKKIALVFICFLLYNSVLSQDTINRIQGSPIVCKITSITDSTISFSFTRNDATVNSFIPRNKVTSFYQAPPPAPKKKTGTKQDIFPLFRFAIDCGPSYLLADVPENTPSDLKTAAEDMKWAGHFGAEINFFGLETVGFGLKTSYFGTSCSARNVSIPQTIDRYTFNETGDFNDEISTVFFGPEVCLRQLLEYHDQGFYGNIALGALSYSETTRFNQTITYSGTTFGTVIDFGYDADLTDNLALGFKISYTGGTLSYLVAKHGTNTENITLEDKNQIGLHRLDFSIGFRFNSSK